MITSHIYYQIYIYNCIIYKIKIKHKTCGNLFFIVVKSSATKNFNQYVLSLRYHFTNDIKR